MNDPLTPSQEPGQDLPERVALLFGGVSSEHEISILSASQVIRGLAELSMKRPLSVQPIYINREGDWIWAPASESGSLPGGEFIQAAEQWEFDFETYDVEIMSFSGGLSRLAEEPTDVALLILHGQNGEDGRLQGALDLAGIPYTGSGAPASALAFDKGKCQAVFHAAGLPIARSTVIAAGGLEGAERIFELAGRPCVIKPSRGGSSVGISIVRQPEELPMALERAFEIDDEVLAERYVQGRELTCGLIERKDELLALPVTEIIPPEGRFFDYAAKYEPGVSREVTPATITPALAVKIQMLARAAFRACGCRGFARVDFIADPDDPVILEINTIPGMTATSLLPQAAAAQGISFAELLGLILDSARHD